jgi:hypothetical protein
MRNTKRSEQLNLKVAGEIIEGIKTASRSKFMSNSEYIRQAIVAQLERDGICLVAA